MIFCVPVIGNFLSLTCLQKSGICEFLLSIVQLVSLILVLLSLVLLLWCLNFLVPQPLVPQPLNTQPLVFQLLAFQPLVFQLLAFNLWCFSFWCFNLWCFNLWCFNFYFNLWLPQPLVSLPTMITSSTTSSVIVVGSFGVTAPVLGSKGISCRSSCLTRFTRSCYFDNLYLLYYLLHNVLYMN